MMRQVKLWMSLTTLLLGLVGSPSVLQAAEPAEGSRAAITAPEATFSPEGATDTVATSASALRDARAEDMIRQLTARAAKRPAFRFTFIDSFDDVQPDGQKIMVTHLRKGIVRRPDRLLIETTGDIANRTLVKDGKQLTLWDRDENVYAQVADPGTIDQALDLLIEKYHLAVPAADLFYADPAGSLLGQVITSAYIGLSHVGEVPCHHLAFTGELVDWQVWIDEGDKPALRKLVIDYRDQPGRPQYALTVLSVEPLETAADELFKLALPEGAEKIEMQSTAADPIATQPAHAGVQ